MIGNRRLMTAWRNRSLMARSSSHASSLDDHHSGPAADRGRSDVRLDDRLDLLTEQSGLSTVEAAEQRLGTARCSMPPSPAHRRAWSPRSRRQAPKNTTPPKDRSRQCPA